MMTELLAEAKLLDFAPTVKTFYDDVVAGARIATVRRDLQSGRVLSNAYRAFDYESVRSRNGGADWPWGYVAGIWKRQ